MTGKQPVQLLASVPEETEKSHPEEERSSRIDDSHSLTELQRHHSEHTNLTSESRIAMSRSIPDSPLSSQTLPDNTRVDGRETPAFEPSAVPGSSGSSVVKVKGSAKRRSSMQMDSDCADNGFPGVLWTPYFHDSPPDLTIYNIDSAEAFLNAAKCRPDLLLREIQHLVETVKHFEQEHPELNRKCLAFENQCETLEKKNTKWAGKKKKYQDTINSLVNECNEHKITIENQKEEIKMGLSQSTYDYPGWPDVHEFDGTGTYQDWKRWRREVEVKVKHDPLMFRQSGSDIDYALFHCNGIALDIVINRAIPGSLNPYQSLREMLDDMDSTFGIENQEVKALLKLKDPASKQRLDEPFQAFVARTYSLMNVAAFTDTQKIFHLDSLMDPDLRRYTLSIVNITDYRKYTQQVAQIANNIAHMNLDLENDSYRQTTKSKFKPRNTKDRKSKTSSLDQNPRKSTKKDLSAAEDD